MTGAGLGLCSRREILDHGLDSGRLKQAGFQYRCTSPGAVQSFAEALRLRRTIGERRPAYTYDQVVEAFFRHSPAIIRKART